MCAEQEFARLYDETSARVHGLVLRVVRDPALAEQITLQVYLHAWQTGWHRHGTTPSASSLMATAHRKAVDGVRTAEQAATRAASREVAPAPRATVSHAALGRLTDLEREVVELAYFGGYTHTEVTALIGARVGTARAVLRTALRELRRVPLQPA